MKLMLSDQEREFLDRCKEVGILTDIRGHRLPSEEGVIDFPCPDCDQALDIFEHIVKICRGNGHQPRIHSLRLNGGGGILIDPQVKIPGGEIRGKILMEDLEGTVEMKGILMVVLSPHFPCGVAHKHHLTPREIFEGLVRAKNRIKDTDKRFKVACFVQVDWGNGKKRTYHFSRDRWLANQHLLP